jgi:hypothetical protein
MTLNELINARNEAERQLAVAKGELDLCGDAIAERVAKHKVGDILTFHRGNGVFRLKVQEIKVTGNLRSQEAPGTATAADLFITYGGYLVSKDGSLGERWNVVTEPVAEA